MSTEALRSYLDSILDDLGEEELLVVSRLAARVRDGQLRYGELDLRRDDRDWQEELRQELEDANIYREFEDVRRVLRSDANGKE